MTTPTSSQKPKLDKARQLRGIYFIDPDDEEFVDIMKNARGKLEVPMPAAMLCKTHREKYRETCSFEKKRKTKNACIVEADESTRERMEGTLHEGHEDHIAGKGLNSWSHFNLVRKCIPVPQAMKKPDATAAVDEEWRKLEKIPAWQLTKARNKREVIAEAWNESKTVHSASLMDVCHLKNSELEPQFPKYKSRVVLRGDIVKDDPGSYAVCTVQGSSASQMTAANSNGCHITTTRMRRTSSRRNIS